MLSEMERETNYRIGRGSPNAGDAIWLASAEDLRNSDPVPGEEWHLSNTKQAAELWSKRRSELATHLYYSKKS